MFELAEPWWQFVVRGTVVYLFLFALFRFGGRRQAGQLTPFDLTLLLIISNALQNAMVGSDTSLLGGVIVVLTLVMWTRSLGFFSSRSKRVERALEAPRIAGAQRTRVRGRPAPQRPVPGGSANSIAPQRLFRPQSGRHGYP